MIGEIRQNFTEASASVGLILATALVALDPSGFFCVSRFVACDSPGSGNNRLVCFEDFSDLSYSCHLQE